MNKPPTNPTPLDGYEIPDIKLSTDLTEDSFFWSPRDGEWLSTFPLSDSMIEGMILVDARFCRPIQPATKQEPFTPESQIEVRGLAEIVDELREPMDEIGRLTNDAPASGTVTRLLSLYSELQALADKEMPSSDPFDPERERYDMLDLVRKEWGKIHSDLNVPVSIQHWAESVTKLLGVLAQENRK